MGRRVAEGKDGPDIRRFHGTLWREWRKAGVADDDLRASLARLLQQGYCATEISLMFGVSRERVRQWCEKYDVNACRITTWGSMGRVWDWELMHFRPITWGERRRLDISLTRLARDRVRDQQRKKVRRQHVERVRKLIKTLGRAPTTKEVGATLGLAIPTICHYWVGRRRYRLSANGGHGTAGTYFRGFRRLVRVAGAEPRGRGWRGHTKPASWVRLNPTTAQEIRRLYSSGDYSQATIADMYGVSGNCIYAVVCGRTWNGDGP